MSSQSCQATADQLTEDRRVSAALDLAKKCKEKLTDKEIQDLAMDFGKKIGVEVKKDKSQDKK